MDKEKIKEAVKVYLNEENSDYAIMLNGKWGCGKTYFVKNELIDHIQEQDNREVIYISLFGITNIDELYNNISLHLVNIKANEYAQNKRKLYDHNAYDKKINTSESNSISFWAGMLNKSFNLLPQSETLKKITADINGKVINFNKYVFIFDDLERNSLGYTTLLGFFDKVADQNNLKAILVCDENKIKEKDKDEFYKTFKEKVIGLTIEYNSNMDAEFDNIVSYYVKNEDVKKYFSDNKKRVLSLFKSADSYNLRTLISACKRFAELYEKIEDIYFKHDTEHKYAKYFFKEILLAIIGSSILIKEQCKNNDFKDREKILSTVKKKNKEEERYFYLDGKYSAYKFVDEYLKNYYFDNLVATEIVIEFIKDAEIAGSDIIIKLQEMYNIDDDNEIKKRFQEVFDLIKMNQININVYPKILDTIFIFGKELGENEKLENIKKYAKDNADKRASEFSVFSWRVFSYDDDDARKFKDELFYFLKDKKVEKAYLDWCSIFEKDDKFVEKIEKYMLNKQANMDENSKLMSLISVDKAFERIKNLNAEQISDFWTCLTYVYGSESLDLNKYYHADKEFFRALKEKIENELLIVGKKTVSQRLKLRGFCNYLGVIYNKL